MYSLLISAGCEAPGTGCGVARIRVGTHEYFHNGYRGFNVVLLSASGAFKRKGHFDTYGRSDASAKLENFLDTAAKGDWIVASVRDEAKARLRGGARRCVLLALLFCTRLTCGQRPGWIWSQDPGKT